MRVTTSRHSREVTLNDLIGLLEDEDPELTDLTQRMDPSGRIRRDLVAQLDSLRHRNSALFEGGGESLRFPLGHGDLVVMGTPAGVGHARKPPVWMKAGDVIEVEIEGIGILRNPIVDEVDA
mgnify:CR=1 FL=1